MRPKTREAPLLRLAFRACRDLSSAFRASCPLPLAARRQKTCVCCGPHAFSRPCPFALAICRAPAKHLRFVASSRILKASLFNASARLLAASPRFLKTRRFEHEAPGPFKMRAHPGQPGRRAAPPLGWRSWNFMKQNVSQARILAQVAAVVEPRDGRPSLAEVGYIHVGIDDGCD